MYKFYKNIITQNLSWIRTVSVLALLSALFGFVSFVIFPESAQEILNQLREVFRDILGEDEPRLTLSQAWLIFQNNLTTAFLSLFLGIILGIVPALTVGFNFFIFGFLLAVFAFSPEHGLIEGVFVFVVSVLPHALLEIPAFLISAGFGLKLGFFWRDPAELAWVQKLIKVLKQNLQVVPLLIVLFAAAALIEVFVTGNLVRVFAQ